MPAEYEYQLPQHKIDLVAKFDIRKLEVDLETQRLRNQRRVNKLADAFIPDAARTIVVSARSNGTFFIVDGQHRVAAGLAAGLTSMRAEVHYGLERQDEATLFLLCNREGTKPGVMDEYRVGLTSGIPLFVDTNKVLEKLGIKAGGTSTNSIGAVSGLLKITEEYGPNVLERTLVVAESAWTRENNGACWDGTLIGGIGMLIGKHPDLDDERLIKRMQATKFTPAKWLAKVMDTASAGGSQHAGGGGRVGAMYKHLVVTYNGKGGRRPAGFQPLPSPLF